MRTLDLLAATLSVAVIVPTALAVLPGHAPASFPVTILMGETKAEGGTAKLGEVDPAVIPTSGPNATGSVSNQIPGGVVWADLDFTIKNGSADSVSVGGGSPVDFDGDGNSHVSITTSGNESEDYTIHGLSGDGTGKNLVLNVTPSGKETIDGTEIESNIMPAFRFDQMSDQARNGVMLYHEALLALVHNDDESESMTSITGTVSFPGASSANLKDVHLFEADGDPLPYAAVTISDEEFSISDFGGVEEDDFVQVLIVLDAELSGDLVRARLQGAFAP